MGRDLFATRARDAVFRDVQLSTASVLHEPHGNFPVFLLTAIR